MSLSEGYLLPFTSEQIDRLENATGMYVSEIEGLIQQAGAAIYWRSKFEAYGRHYVWCDATKDTEDSQDCSCGLGQIKQRAAATRPYEPGKSL